MSFYESIRLIVNVVLILIIVIMIIWFASEMRIQKLNKRLKKYTIAKDERRNSLFDIIYNTFNKWCGFLTKILYKSPFLKKYSLHYEKYIDRSKNGIHDPMDYISIKFILSIVALIILTITDVIQGNTLTFLQIIVAFSSGFFALDIYMITKKKYVKYRMENDLLKAITIMNNSFKSGRSIIETIKIVSDEIDGPLKEEFEKMENDLQYGLEIEVVFERFNKRVNLPTVKYITTSLTILNRTGGNIVNVFSSIETTVFNNKKLQDELRNLSAASKALSRLLLVIPIIFVGVIYILDPGYFKPLYQTSLGIMISIIIVVIYVIYIIIVNKIIKIKEY